MPPKIESQQIGRDTIVDANIKKPLTTYSLNEINFFILQIGAWCSKELLSELVQQVRQFQCFGIGQFAAQHPLPVHKTGLFDFSQQVFTGV